MVFKSNIENWEKMQKKKMFCSLVLPRYMEQSDLILENRNNFLKSSNEQCQARLLEAEQEKVRFWLHRLQIWKLLSFAAQGLTVLSLRIATPSLFFLAELNRCIVSSNCQKSVLTQSASRIISCVTRWTQWLAVCKFLFILPFSWFRSWLESEDLSLSLMDYLPFVFIIGLKKK